jgi:hypothetical protein
MTRSGNEDQLAFWEHVRRVLKGYLHGRQIGNGQPSLTQAKLAHILGVHPATLANFLSSTNQSLGGFAIARACSLGIEFECDRQRIGRVNRQTDELRTPLAEQLVLEFSADFQISHESDPLIIQLKRGPSKAEINVPTGFRLKIVS